MLLWIDSFDGYGSTNGNFPTGLDVRYSGLASQVNTIITDGRTPGSKAVALGHSAAPVRFIETPSFGNVSVWVVGFGYKPGVSFDSTDTRLLSLLDSGSLQITLNVTASGQLQLRRGDVNGTTLGTSVTTMTTNTWHFIEFKVTIGNSGSYEVRLNGVNILSGSADTQNTANAFAQTLKLFGAQDSSIDIRWAYDDLYILDSSGSANIDFLGSMKVTAIFPSGTGDSTQLTPSAGDNYAAVDDNPHDSDSTYVESATSGQQDLYAFGDVDLVNIKGAMISAVCRETDANPFSIKLVAKSGSTTDEGSGIAIGSTSYVSRHRILELDPDTSSAWEDAGIDAAQFGIEIA